MFKIGMKKIVYSHVFDRKSLSAYILCPSFVLSPQFLDTSHKKLNWLIIHKSGDMHAFSENLQVDCSIP